MEQVTLEDIKTLYTPAAESHKGQNGRLLVVGGSHLFHAASLWALTVASRIVDLVHYSSVPENNEIVKNAKEEFRNGIVVPRSDAESYVKEDDCILIGPGMTRDPDTQAITNSLVGNHLDKRWVIDAGALQMIDLSFVPPGAILTPHQGEFEGLLERAAEKVPTELQSWPKEQQAGWFAKTYNCIVLLKGQVDIACRGEECRVIEGGNAGMTKGGTGDVLAGLIAALACKNDPWLATLAGSFINKKAGDELYLRVGPNFNATDLTNQIPLTMKELFVL